MASPNEQMADPKADTPREAVEEVLREFRCGDGECPRCMAYEIARLRTELSEWKQMHTDSERVAQQLDRLWQQMAGIPKQRPKLRSPEPRDG